jgi:hypothetical protein
MKKIILKSIPYFFILILIGGIRFQFLDGYFADKRTFYTQFQDNELNNSWLIVGDSKSQFGFNDSIITHAINKKYLNLSIWGARPLDYLQNLNNHSIKNSIIFVVISSRTFLEPDSMYRFHRSADLTGIFDFNLFTSFRNYFNTDVTKKEQGAWEYTHQQAGSLIFKYEFRPWASYARYDDSVHQAENIKLFGKNRFVEIKLEHLSKLINQYKDNSNKILLISLPERDCYKNWVNRNESILFDKIKVKTGLDVIDFGTLDDMYFYDSHHLNNAGTRYFTAQFLAKFSQLY